MYGNGSDIRLSDVIYYMTMPKISVITGAYNIENQLVFGAAMDSILNQTLSDFEFIICDDGSNDGTYERLIWLSVRDSRVKVLKSPRNEGLASALNRCLAVASGSFIARQDTDDLSSTDRFEKQVAFLNEHAEISFVGSNTELYDEKGVYGNRNFPTYPSAKDFLFSLPFLHGTIMFRRDALKNAGGYRAVKETLRTEDYDLLMRMYAMGMRGANINEPLYRFLEDNAAQNRRKYSYRIDEAKVRWKGFSSLGLLPGGFPYVIKPLIVGLIPLKVLRWLKRNSGRVY